MSGPRLDDLICIYAYQLDTKCLVLKSSRFKGLLRGYPIFREATGFRVVNRCVVTFADNVLYLETRH